MKSKIDELNPIYYENFPERYPAEYIDHFDKSQRKILCISDGSQELQYFIEGDTRGEFDLESVIHIADVDDFTYYLREIVEKKLLKAGNLYTLIDAFPEMDVEFGMVKVKELEGQAKEGIPGFLFEELEPKEAAQRKENIRKYWKKIESEIENDERDGIDE